MTALPRPGKDPKFPQIYVRLTFWYEWKVFRKKKNFTNAPKVTSRHPIYWTRGAVEAEVMLRSPVSLPACLGVGTHMGPMSRFLLLSNNCKFFGVRRPLWRDDGYVAYNCSWASPEQSSSVPSPAGPVTTFYCPKSQTPQTWKPGSHIYIPRNRVAHLYLQAQRFHLCSSTPASLVPVDAEVVLRSTVSRPVCLGVEYQSGAHDNISITVRQLRVCSCGTSSLIGWVWIYNSRRTSPLVLVVYPQSELHRKPPLPRIQML
jgi:hypothetical protein